MDTKLLVDFLEKCDRAKVEIHKEIIGLDEHIDLLFCALLAKGHVIIEGEPGEAKTILANIFFKTFNLTQGRIQMTADIMPNDVRIAYGLLDSPAGVELRNLKITRGALFKQLLLIDEINRASGKTQSVLLEPLEEGTITYENQTIVLDKPYMVVATMNPIETAGGGSVNPLPAAACDRFMFKDFFTFPDMAMLKQICVRDRRTKEIGKVFDSADEILEIQNLVTEFRLQYDEHHAIVEYMARLIDCIRNSGLIRDKNQVGSGGYGPTPRAMEDIIDACAAHAVLNWRQRTVKHITFDDVKRMIFPAARFKFMMDSKRLNSASGIGIKSNDDLMRIAIENTIVPFGIIRRS